MTKYNEQYCEKHNQHYGAHLHRCPICLGEEFGKIPVKHERWDDIHPEGEDKSK